LDNLAIFKSKGFGKATFESGKTPRYVLLIAWESWDEGELILSIGRLVLNGLEIVIKLQGMAF
jgi:hypothetical protein